MMLDKYDNGNFGDLPEHKEAIKKSTVAVAHANESLRDHGKFSGKKAQDMTGSFIPT